MAAIAAVAKWQIVVAEVPSLAVVKMTALAVVGMAMAAIAAASIAVMAFSPATLASAALATNGSDGNESGSSCRSGISGNDRIEQQL